MADSPADQPIDPLIKSARTDKQVAENWHDDPWDIVVDNSDSSVEPRDFREMAPILRVVLAAVVCFSLFLGAIGLWYLHKVNPSGGSSVGVSFTVNDGDSVSSVSSRLESEGFITSAGVFRWYVGRKGGIELTPGYYAIRPHDHMGNIMKVLSTPPSATFVKVTFPEGFTLLQMAKRLAEKTFDSMPTCLTKPHKTRLLNLCTDLRHRLHLRDCCFPIRIRFLVMSPRVR